MDIEINIYTGFGNVTMVILFKLATPLLVKDVGCGTQNMAVMVQLNGKIEILEK
tara:strand:+ start:11095 stop:11256 length:162 start_codon:yes stop_codon:yes gene_type:complete